MKTIKNIFVSAGIAILCLICSCKSSGFSHQKYTHFRKHDHRTEIASDKTKESGKTITPSQAPASAQSPESPPRSVPVQPLPKSGQKEETPVAPVRKTNKEQMAEKKKAGPVLHEKKQQSHRKNGKALAITVFILGLLTRLSLFIVLPGGVFFPLALFSLTMGLGLLYMIRKQSAERALASFGMCIALWTLIILLLVAGAAG